MRMSTVQTWNWGATAAFVLLFGFSGCDGGDSTGGGDAGRSLDTGEPESDVGPDPDTPTDADGGDCPDGGWGDVPESRPGRLIATPSDGFTVDGQIDEQSRAGFEFDDPGGESDNQISMHAQWSPDHLYVGVRVTDDQIEADSSTGPWLNDSIELAFDRAGGGAEQLGADHRKWLVDVDGTARASRGEQGDWTEAASDASETAAQQTGDGYVVEFQVPWSAIGGLEQAKSQGAPGVIVVVNDRDGGETRRFSWTGSVDQLRTPSEWGTLYAADPSCADGSEGDAGPGDVDDGGDVDAGGSESRLGPPRYIQESDFNFEHRLHAVDDLGMDPTCGDPIDQKLDQARAPNTLIVFPPGEYCIEAGSDRNATHDWGTGADHFGIKGLGDDPKDVQFVVEKQSAEYGGRWIADRGGEGLMLKNFAIQMHRDRYTSADMWIQKEDLILIEEVEWAGLIPNDDHANNALLTCEITDPAGTGEINRVYMREGSYMPGYPDGMAGIRMSLGHEGTLYLTDLWLEQVNSSAIRFTKVPGRVGVEGGFYKNNANTNLRGGAGSHPDGPSYMRGATVVVDTEDYNDYQPSDQPMTTTQGLRVDSSGRGDGGLIVEDVDFYFLNTPEGSEVVIRPGFGEHDAFTLRDVDIRNETSGSTAVIQDVSTPSDETARFEDVHVTGSGSGPLTADSETSAEIVDSCVESNFSIQNFSTSNVDRSGCEGPTAPIDDPHSH